MIDQLKIIVQYILPKHLLTLLAGKLAEAKMGKFTTFLIESFIKKVVNLPILASANLPPF